MCCHPGLAGVEAEVMRERQGFVKRMSLRVLLLQKRAEKPR